MDMRQNAFVSCLQEIRMHISKREEQKTDLCRRYNSRRKKFVKKNLNVKINGLKNIFV